MEKLVAPPYPSLFASGCIINGFTPQEKRYKKETESLIKAIDKFKVDIVIVIDYEKLEKQLENEFKKQLYDRKIIVHRCPKS